MQNAGNPSNSGKLHLSSIADKHQAGFVEAVKVHLAQNTSRVSRMVFEGQRYWVKRVELVTGRTRILKPAPKHIFRREMRIYEELKSKGVPVPEMVLKGAEFVVFEDGGPTLENFWRDADLDTEKRAFISRQTAQALAHLHALGISHGRPVARDICWDGKKATFLDFENYSERRNSTRGRAIDLLCFVHSLCSQIIRDEVALTAAIEGYRESDKIGVWEEARVLVRRYRWLDVLTYPLQARKDPHAREFKALPKMREIFA